MMSGNVQYSIPDGEIPLHISDALVANSSGGNLATHIKDDPAVKLGRSSDYHLKTRSKTSVFNCDVCERTFESAEFLSSHVLSHSLDIGAYSCEICHKVFAEKHDLAQHKCLQNTEMHSQNLIQDTNSFHPQTDVPRSDLNGPFGCVSGMGSGDGCSGSGHDIEGDYNLGLNSQKGVQSFPCEYCEKKFKTNSALLIHRRSHTGETPYPCEFCGKSFRQSAHLDVHMRIHTGEMPYKCAYCDKSFTQKNNRNRHQMLHLNPNGQESSPVVSNKPHSENCLDTPTAPTIGNMSAEPPRHFNYENPPMTPPAPVGTNYSQPPGSSQFTYQCNVCQKVYSNNSALNQHLQSHNKDHSFDCYVCSHKFKQRAHLETHLRVHTHEMPYKCQYCDKSFSQKGNKNRHERLHLVNDAADMSGTMPPSSSSHTNSTSLSSTSVAMEPPMNSAKSCIQQPNIYIDSEFASCDICHKQFFSKDDLHTHRNTHHSMSGDPSSMNHTMNMESPHPQMTPGQYGPSYCNISSDKNYHARESPQAQFSPSKPMAVDHNSAGPGSNMGNKMYYDGGNVGMPEPVRQPDPDCCNVGTSHLSPCEVCGKEISCQQEMLQHAQCHKGVFTCEYCPKEFRSNSALLVHRRVHTGETPYKCDFCDKGFKQAPHLDVHLRTHTGEMPFQCLYCDKKFTQNSNKNRHQRTHFLGEAGSGFNSPSAPNQGCANQENGEDLYTNNLKCELCGCVFADRNSFVNHMLSHQSSSGNVGVTPDNQKHSTLTHGLTHLYQCTICNAGFSCQPSLDNHVAMVHNGKNNVMPPTNSDGSMQYGQQPPQEDLNNIKNNQRRPMDYMNMPHLGTPSEMGNSGPPEDGNNYMHSQNTNYYDMGNNSLGGGGGSCGGAGSSDASSNGQEAYGGYGSNREPVVNMNCEFCQKNFKSMSSLNIHRRVHTGETPFQCSFCHRGFKQNAHLEVHMRTHTGETPFKCEFCDKRFTQKSNRDRHQRTHLVDAVSLQNSDIDFPMENSDGKDSAAEPYKCDVCSSVFTNHDDYTDHRSCHDIPRLSEDTRRPYGRRKYDSVDPNPNEARGPGGGEGGVYKCDLCGCYFSNLPDLRHHQNSQHSQDMYPQGDNLRNGANNSCPPQYSGNVDSYNYQPEPKRYCSDRSYSHNGSGYHDGDVTPMSGPMPPSSSSNVSYQGRNDMGYMRQEENSYCDMGNNYCSGQRKPGPPQTTSHHGDSPSTSQIGKGEDEASNLTQHVCHFCQKSFRSMSALLVHRRIHTGETPFQCDYCQKCFKQNAHLDVHLRTHTGETPFKCEFCDKHFTQNCNRNRHQRTHLGDAVSLQGQVDMHGNVSGADTPYRCDVCPSEFTNRDDFMDHRSCHDIPQLYEEAVKKNPSTRRGRRRGPIKSYVEIDDDDFDNDDDMPVSDMSYGCNQCDEKCTATNDRQRHMNNHPVKNDPARYQSQTSTAYRDNQKYQHYRQDPYQCEICPQKFYGEEELCQHRLTHMNNPYGGEMSGSYPSHQNTAAATKHPDGCMMDADQDGGNCGNMKFDGNKCELCYKMFSSTSALTTHMRVHTGETPYKCDFCHRAFKQTAHLEVHMRVHTGETPFKCHYCDKRFTQKNNMMRHEKVHHGDTSGSMSIDSSAESMDGHCQTCDVQCRSRPNLSDHQNECPGTPDSVSDCDICCKESSVKSDLCPYSEPHHNSKNKPIIKSPKESKISMGKFDKKSVLKPKDKMPTYDCCPDQCHTEPEIKNKSSDFPVPPDQGPMESMVLQLPYACRHCKIEFLNQEDLCDHEPQCGAANFIPPGPSGKFPPLESTENEAVYLDDSQMLTNNHQCEFCQKVFKSFSSLSVHRRVHTGEAPFECHFCQRRFKQNSHLEVHLRTHTDEAPYKCEFCDKCFTQVGNRNRHQRTHFMEAVSLVPAEFDMLEQEDGNNQGDSLEQYQVGAYQDNDSRGEIPNLAENVDAGDVGHNDAINEGDDNGGREEVNVPLPKKRKRGRPKGSRSFFKIERQPSPDSVKMEVAEDPILDDMLPNPTGRPRTRSFSRLKSSDKKTAPAADIEKSFICKACNLGYGSADALSYHLQSLNHSAEVGNSNNKNIAESCTFICEYCDKTFTNGSALAVHRRVHTGEAPFKCQYCHKCFKQNAHLDVHMRIHTGETPFQCAFCDKRFTQNCNRLRHQKTHFTNVTSGQDGAVIFDADIIGGDDDDYDADADSNIAAAAAATDPAAAAAATAFKCELCNHEFNTKHIFDNHVCVYNSYDDDNVRPLLPSDNILPPSSEDKKTIPDKGSSSSSSELKEGQSETSDNDGIKKISKDPPTATTSSPDFDAANKLIKEENSPQKDFSEIESIPHQFQSGEDQGESSCDENRVDTDDALSEKRDSSDSKSGDFSCDFCSRTFRNQSALLTHRRTHTGETPYQCTYCSKSFKQVAHLDTHLRVHTGEKPYKCKYCKKSFTQKSNRNRHEQVHELSGKTRSSKGSVPEYRCELCDGYFANVTDLDMHRCTMTAGDEWLNHAGDTDISADSQNLPYTCNICGKEYSSRVRFEKHRLTHEQGRKEENMSPLMERNGQSGMLAAGQLTFFCEVCRQKFTDKTEYTDHIFMHISENRYQQNQGTYKNPKDVHMEEIREVCYLCEQCQNEFYTKNDFHNHKCLKNVPNGKGPKNRYSSQNSENMDDAAGYNSEDFGLSASNASQSEDFPDGDQGLCNKSFFDCEFCNKTFKNHSTMLIHRRIHTGEMPFKCKFCERCFKQNAHLEVHLRTHTGETPFHCRFCEKSFTQKSNRNRHERTHLMNSETDENQLADGAGGSASFEENFHCNLCSVDFSTEDDLNEHLLTHTDDELGSGFQPMGSYLTTLKEEQEIYEREASSSGNGYQTSLADGSLPYPENTSMVNLYDTESGLEEEEMQLAGNNKMDASGQFFECEFCHKQLKSLSSLIVHRRVHTGEAPFKCKYCERSFKQSAHLEVHMRTHTGETPYKCDFCDKSFTQNSNRLRHQRLHFMDTTSIGDDNSGPTDLLNDSGTKDQTDTLTDTAQLSL